MLLWKAPSASLVQITYQFRAVCDSDHNSRDQLSGNTGL